MRVTVLGSAAGGGFPQWNCACSNCSQVRTGTPRFRPRSQAQLVISSDAGQPILVNAAPDLRTQILSSPTLTPARAPRHSPISTILLTSADVDSVAGLLHLREFQPLRIHSTPSVRRILLEENRIFRVLDRGRQRTLWQDMPAHTWFCPEAASSGTSPTIRCLAVPLGGSFPDYVSEPLRHLLAPSEAVVGLLFEERGKKFFYAPALPPDASDWRQHAQSSDLSLLDGTFWSDDELIATGASAKTAREIGHVPLSSSDGLLKTFRRQTGARRVLIHINNTNPILDEESVEKREARDAGWEIAYDGMQIEL